MSYVEVGRHLLSTGAFPTDTALRTPVFPSFIALAYALFGEREWALILAQTVLGILNVGLTWSLAKQLVLSRAAHVAAVLMALSLDSISISFLILSETLFTFLLLLSLWCLVRFRHKHRIELLVLSAGLLGLAILCRPIAILLPVVLAGTLLVGTDLKARSVAGQLCLFGITTILVVTPWIWHNARGIGVRTLSSVSSVNLLFYYAARVEADLRDIPDQLARTELNRQLVERLRQQGSPDIEANRTRASTAMAMSIIREHPLRFVLLNLRSDLRSLIPDLATPGDIVGLKTGEKGTMAVFRRQGVRAAVAHFLRDQSWFIWVVLTLATLLFVALMSALLGAWLLLRARAWYPALMLLLPSAYLLLMPGAAATARFKVPALPYLSILAGVGLVSVATDLRQRSRALAARANAT